MAIKISKNRIDMDTKPVRNTGYLDVNQIATPAEPAASNTRVYAKADGTLYILPQGGAETAVGGIPLAQKAAASGVASLNASSLVVQKPADRLSKANFEITLNKLLKGAGAGADPTEIDVPAAPTIVRKTANEDVSNSLTLQNDDHLSLTIAASGVWLVELYLLATAQGAGYDLKVGFAYPSGCTIYWGSKGQNWLDVVSGGTAQAALLIQTSTCTFDVSADIIGIRISAIVINSTNAGTLNFQWAQATGPSSYWLRLMANSCLVAYKLA